MTIDTRRIAGPAPSRRFATLAFVFTGLALVLGNYLPALLLDLSGFTDLAVYLTVSLGMVATGLLIAHRSGLRFMLAELGMDRSPLAGWGSSFLLTLPMAVGFALLGRGVFGEASLEPSIESPSAFFQGWLVAGIVEETLFRGYLFKQLVVRGGWSQTRAMLTCGAIFGLLHIPPAWDRPAGEIAGAVAVTALGGAAFCWLLARWDWNLWFVIGWHALVNLWWLLGSEGASAAGDGYGNALRVAVIALTFLAASRRPPSRDLGLE